VKLCAIEIGRTAAAAILAAGICFLHGPVRAEDSVPGSSPAASEDAGTQRAVVMISARVGGLRSGEAMMVTGRGAERVRAPAEGGTQCVSAVAAQ